MGDGGEFQWELPAKGLIRFRKIRGLRRVFAAVAQAVATLDKPGSRLVGQAQSIQLLKALRQVAADKGSWRVAWKFVNLPDPYTPTMFGGTERELEVIATELRAEDDLRRRLRGQGSENKAPSGTDDEPEEPDGDFGGADENGDGKKKKSKKKTKKKEGD